MTAFSLQTLGFPEIHGDDRPIKLNLRKGLALLIYLAEGKAAVARTKVIDVGRFALDDPIARWAPELSQMRVLRSPDASLVETEPAERPITFEDLLTHRSGLTYGDFHPWPDRERLRASPGRRHRQRGGARALD
jgi:hypothetical protein